MKITPDSSLYTALARTGGASTPVRSGEGFQTLDDAIRRVSKVDAVKPRTAEPDTRGGGDARAFAREAPTGPRPRYVAKGQMLDILA